MNKSLRKASGLAASIAALWLSQAQPSRAVTFNTFTDFTSWQAASSGPRFSPIFLEDFNDEPSRVLDGPDGTFNNVDLGDFRLSGNARRLGIRDATVAFRAGTDEDNIDGTTFLEFDEAAADNFIEVAFESPLRSFGFDWRNDDTSSDAIQLTVEDQVFVFGIPGTSLDPERGGFFGIVATDGTFDTMRWSLAPGGGGRLQTGSFDNVHYSVDIPFEFESTLGLLVVGSCFAVLHLRKRYLSK